MPEKKGITKKGDKHSYKKIIFLGISIFVILIIIFVFIFNNKEQLVLTIDNVEYTKSDFNMYAYLIKYDYFGIDGTEISKDALNTLVSSDSDQTVGEYLKEKTISKIKVSAAILRIANENNITLNEDDLKSIEEEKEKFIELLGGKNQYGQILKSNDTNIESFIEIAKVNKLYDKIYEKLYAKDMRNDLTEDELNEYTKTYKSDYVKIKQIILLKKDLDTNKYLDEITLNQKETLANELAKMAKDSDDFDNLIKKYSESYNGEIEAEYYLKSSLVEELRNAIDGLDIGDTSEVVSTDNAYHIIIREKLDNSKLEEYYDSKREEKLIEDINDNLEKIAIINNDYLEKITVK